MALFGKKKNEDFFGPKLEEIDIDKRYDVYSFLDRNRICVYRNIKFIKQMALPSERHSFGQDYWQIEQSDGKIILVQIMINICICEVGEKPNFEIISLNDL